jgi:uncharacterized protein (DUF2147 family)
MKLTFTISLLFVFSLGLFAQEEVVKGIYYNTEKTSKIKIFKATDGKYYGKIVWMEHPEKKDIHNPDVSKQNDPVMDMLIVKGFTYDAKEKQWSGGTIYDPDNGKTYDCYMWFEENQTIILDVKGYVMGMKFLGREVEWTRTEL